MSKLSISLLNLLILILVALALPSHEICGEANKFASGGQIPETQKVPVEGGGSYTDVSVTGLAMMLKNKDFLLINVHIPYEGEIEKTDLFIPYNEIEQNLDKLPSNKETKIILYCKTDRMSIIAAYTLVKLGFNNVWNLKGGMTAWRQAGYPLIEKKGSFK